MEGWPSRTYPFELPLRYQLLGRGTQGLVVALHGYQDHAASFMRRLDWLNKEPDFPVLAVNAPFPVPLHTKAGFMEAYSWYFRDSTRGYSVFSPQQSAQHIVKLIKDLQLFERPTVLLGFSQGGYLAPFLAQHLPSTRAIIGLGCGFPEDSYASLKNISVYGVHGTEDERVSFAKSQGEHARLMSAGFKGQFQGVEGLSHRVDSSLSPIVQSYVQECLA